MNGCDVVMSIVVAVGVTDNASLSFSLTSMDVIFLVGFILELVTYRLDGPG